MHPNPPALGQPGRGNIYILRVYSLSVTIMPLLKFRVLIPYLLILSWRRKRNLILDLTWCNFSSNNEKQQQNNDNNNDNDYDNNNDDNSSNNDDNKDKATIAASTTDNILTMNNNKLVTQHPSWFTIEGLGCFVITFFFHLITPNKKLYRSLAPRWPDG